MLPAALSAVKEFGRALTTRFGSPAGRIETFIEVPLELNGSYRRPDGPIWFTQGQTVMAFDDETEGGDFEEGLSRRITGAIAPWIGQMIDATERDTPFCFKDRKAGTF